jgi:hypothetical protein
LEARLTHFFKDRYGREFVDQGPYITYGSTPNCLVTTSDINNPGFKKRSSAGEIINGPFTKVTFEITPPPASSYVLDLLITEPTGEEWGTKLSGDYFIFGTYGAPPLLWPSQAQVDEQDAKISLALTSAYAAIDAADMLAGATAAEAGKTVDFFLQTSRRVIRIARAARKLELKRLRKEVSWKEFKERYMEYRYAVRPCIYDMVSLAKAVTAPLGQLRRTYRGNASGSWSDSDTITDVRIPGNISVDVNRKVQYSYSVRAGVLCNVLRLRSQAFGLAKLPETAWELLPFSFMVDWVANVGDTIAAHTPKANVETLASWVTVRSEAHAVNDVGNARLVPELFGQYTSTSVSIGPTSYGQRETIVRRIDSPALRTWPQVDINLNVYKLLDTGIILRKIFR